MAKMSCETKIAELTHERDSLREMIDKWDETHNQKIAELESALDKKYEKYVIGLNEAEKTIAELEAKVKHHAKKGIELTLKLQAERIKARSVADELDAIKTSADLEGLFRTLAECSKRLKGEE